MSGDPVRQAIREFKAGRLLAADSLLAALTEPHAADARAIYYRGLVKWQLGDRAVALKLLAQATAARPRHAAFQKSLGQCRLASGDFKGAVTALEVAFAEEPRSEEIGFALGNAFLAQGDFEQAEKVYRTTLRYHRRSLSVLCNLAGALREQGRIEAAIVELKRALKIAPTFADATYNLGTLHHMSGDTPNAKRAFERAVAAEPSNALAYAALASCDFKLLEDEAAERHLARALALGPEVPDVRWTNFTSLMHRGDLSNGWIEFEWRWRSRLAQASRRSYPLAHWDGGDLGGRSLLVWREQGIGDEIMFASLLDDPKLRNGRLTVFCNPRLESLFSRGFGHVKVVSDEQEVNELIESGAVELQIPAGSLCQYLRPSLDSFPRRASYLDASKAAAQEIAGKLPSQEDGRLRVGLSWRSGNPYEGRRRSVELGQLAPLLSLKGCRFFNLQYGNVAEEVASAGAPMEVLPDTDISRNLENLAALTTNMDLVVSVDNTTVHMAGALGKPVWVLLPTYPDWRWFGCGHTSPWYPSARLFRQSRPGGWDDVITEARAGLEALLSGRIEAAGSR